MNRRIPKQRFLFLFFMSVAIWLVGLLIINSKEHRESDFLVMLTFWVNIMISMAQLLFSINKHPFSLDMMLWIFNLFFFGFAPYLQYLTDSYAWNFSPEGDEVLTTNLLISLWYFCYLLGRKIRISFRKTRHQPPCGTRLAGESYVFRREPMYLLVFAVLFVVAYYIFVIGIENLFSRATNSNDTLGKSAALLTDHGFRNLALFSAVMYTLQAKQRGKINAKTVVVLACFLISCFPTGIPRNMFASFYAGYLIILLDKSRKGRWFSLAILGGIVLIFPAIDIFRRIAQHSDQNILTLILSSVQNTYLTGDYDAHQMFITIQRYVQKSGFGYGYPLLGALLFFVPRSIWPSKPLGTGQTAFEALGQHWFTNVSAPLPAEAYMNFGVIGIVAFGLLVGIVVRHVDDRYWQAEDPLSRIRVLYPFFMFQFFFLLRGDLMNGWAYMVAQLVVGSLVYSFAVKKRRQMET